MPAASSENASSGKPFWQNTCDDGEWQILPQKDSDALEALWQQGRSGDQTVNLLQGWAYLVNLQKMTMTNPSSKTIRQLKRCQSMPMQEERVVAPAAAGGGYHGHAHVAPPLAPATLPLGSQAAQILSEQASSVTPVQCAPLENMGQLPPQVLKCTCGNDLQQGDKQCTKCTWSYYSDWQIIFEILESKDVVLIRFPWMVEQCKAQAVLPCRQQVQTRMPGAVWLPKRCEQSNLDRVSGHDPLYDPPEYLIFAVSYCWLTKDHPDPNGVVLQTYRYFLEEFNVAPPSSSAALFFDWLSLYQKPRSPEQFAAFQRALANMHVWYAHTKIVGCSLTSVPEGTKAYHERGWPTFEYSVLSLKTAMTGRYGTFDIGAVVGKVSNGMSLSSAMRLAIATKKPPLPPSIFEQELHKKTFTNGHTDECFVAQSYERVYRELFATARTLNFQGLNWGDEEAVALVPTLQACKQLTYLALDANVFRGDGIIALATAISSPPLLKLVILTSRGFVAPIDTIVALLKAMQRNPSIEKIAIEASRSAVTEALTTTGMLELVDYQRGYDENIYGTFVPDHCLTRITSLQA